MINAVGHGGLPPRLRKRGCERVGHEGRTMVAKLG